MKKYSLLAPLVGLLAVSFAFVGFQCSSAELTSAKLYMQKSEWNKAEAELEKAVASDSLDEESWYYLGIVRGEKKEYSGLMDAFAHAEKISAAHDSDIVQVKLHYWVQAYNQGSKDLQKGRDTASYYKDALHMFKGAVLLEPDSTMGFRGLAYTYINMGNEDSAIAPLEVLWKKLKDQNSAKLIGEIYYEKGSKLKQQFENTNSDQIKIANGLAQIKTGITQYDVNSAIGQPDEKTTVPAKKIRERRRKIREIPAKDIWTYKKLGLTLTFQADTLAEKKVDFVYNPNIDSTNYKLAVQEFENGLAVLKPASQIYQSDAGIMTVLTNCYIGANMTEQAAQAFEMAAENNPTNKDFQYNYGVILLRGNQYPQAIAEFEKTLKIDPEYWNAVYNMGASYVNWGVQIQDSSSQSDIDSVRKVVSAKFQKALPYLEEYSKHSPADPNIWELLGKVYAYLNNLPKAKSAMSRADSLRQMH